MTTIVSADRQRIACATLTYLAEPADPAICGLLQVLSPAELLACIRSGTLPASASGIARGAPATRAALARCRRQLERVPVNAGLASAGHRDIRLMYPGDADWPVQLDDLGAAGRMRCGFAAPASCVPAGSVRCRWWAAVPPPPTGLMSPARSL